MHRLRYMSVFAHIVDCGSITKAADKLQLSKSVVSQHLKSLESDLGVALLKRTTRKQWLTAAGENFYRQCKAINQVADGAWEHAQTAQAVPHGKVRITAPNALMETLVTPVIANLLRQYPRLQPQLISSDQQLDLAKHNIDLAIRVGRSANSSDKQRRIGEFRDILCGQQDYLSTTPIEQARYIANDWQGEQICHQFLPCDDSVQGFEYRATAHCSSNSFHSCLALIKASAGIGLVPEFHPSLSSFALQAVFAQHQLPANAVYVVHSYSQYLPLSVQVCIESIEQQLALHRCRR
ncbi:LysR family transcriptional regulator [Shewanella waksmanii]|uniref:LysR family transcriptional regulator n=1 Tax=Shewanella waksmanii TaxID=213783 RepID=UPI00048F1DB2|nr:LysR family transcriptional regulator [Shewanella waksmanii]